MLRLLDPQTNYVYSTPGKMFDPRVLVWNPCSELRISLTNHSLLVIPEWSNDLKLLTDAVRSTSFCFKLLPFPSLNLFYLLWRIGNTPWGGTPFTWASFAQKFPCTKPEPKYWHGGYGLTVVLVNACTGKVARNFTLRLPPDFASDLYRLVTAQVEKDAVEAKKPWEKDDFPIRCEKAELEYAGGGWEMMAADATSTVSLDGSEIWGGR